MGTKPKAYYKYSFSPNTDGHGGEKRSYQIYKLLSESYDLIKVNEESNTFPNFMVRFWLGIKFFLRHGNFFIHFTKIPIIGFKVFNFNNIMSSYKDVKIFFWEPFSDYSDFYMPYLCLERGIRIVAVPHNIESLVSNNRLFGSNLTSPRWFKKEIDYLSKCDHIFTISLEDQWLLGLYNLESEFLEYHLSNLDTEKAIEISQIRNDSDQREHLLMLGTAHNMPTLEGMVAVIESFLKYKWPFNIRIAGFGTEKLHELYPSLPKNIQVLGTLNKEELQTEFICTKAVLVYQKSGTGFLTRLKELAIMGIPIIANNTSLRSFYGNKGVYGINSLEELPQVFNQELSSPITTVEKLNNQRMKHKRLIDLITYE